MYLIHPSLFINSESANSSEQRRLCGVLGRDGQLAMILPCEDV